MNFIAFLRAVLISDVSAGNVDADVDVVDTVATELTLQQLLAMCYRSGKSVCSAGAHTHISHIPILFKST